MDFLEGYFYSPTQGSLTAEQVLEEILGYMSQKPERFYDIIVGCDSSSSEEPNFPVAVVVLRKGEGGRFFLKKVRYPKSRKFYTFQQRILEEVLLSCQMALALRERLRKKTRMASFTNYQFRYIHADIGENGATKDMIREVTGLIRGSGFEPKIKPESFAASNIADRYT